MPHGAGKTIRLASNPEKLRVPVAELAPIEVEPKYARLNIEKALDNKHYQQGLQYCRNRIAHRNTTLRTRAYLKLLKAQYHKCNNSDTEANKSRLLTLERELESRWDETYEEGGTMNKMVELIQEYHYLITYGDYLSILVKQLKAAVPPAMIPEMEKKYVCEIAGQVRREMREYRAWIEAGEKQPVPNVLMMRNIDAAANQMKISGHDVIFMMQTYAERNDVAHSKVNEYVQNADFAALAKQL